MELYQLKTFLAVAEEGHLTRAASRLHISQPSVSTHIKALEEELGLNLFIRTPKGMTLSSDGDKIKIKAEIALHAAEAVKHKAEELKRVVAGDVRIGLNINAHYLKVPELLSAIQRDCPKLKLHFFQRHSLEVPDLLKKDQLDAGFVFVNPSNPGFETRWLATFGIMIVAPYQWEKRLKNIELEGLVDFPWIWTDQHCPFNKITAGLFEPYNRKPEKVVVVDHDSTIREMVAAGAGLCLMVEAEAREAARQKDVLIFGDSVATLDLSILYLKKKKNAPLLQALINEVNKVWLQSAVDNTPTESFLASQ